MKERLDDKLQELLEKGASKSEIALSSEEKDDLEMYEALIGMIAHHSDNHVPLYFAANVVAAIQKKEDRKQAFVLAFLFALLLVSAIYLFAFLINIEMLQQIAFAFSQYVWVCLFAVVTFVFVQLADKRLVLKTVHP